MNIPELSQDDLYAYHAVLRDDTDATLTMRFKALGTAVIYDGAASPESDDPTHLGKLRFVPFNKVKHESAPDSLPVSIELDLDAAGGVTLERGECWITLRWGTDVAAMELLLNTDPP